MASPAILKASAAAANRRSFAASQSKGSGGPPPPGANLSANPPAPSPAGIGSGAGPVAGLTGLNKAPAAPHPYIAHAVGLSQAAQANGAPDLASAIRSVAATPHPADKQNVAVNYLKTQPPQVAAKHAHMFTKSLMTGGTHGP